MINMTEQEQTDSKDTNNTEGGASSVPPSPTPEKSNLTDTIGKGDDLLAKMKAENDRAEKILKGNQDLAARKLIGGETDAGESTPDKKELTPQEYAEAIMKGQVPKVK